MLRKLSLAAAAAVALGTAALAPTSASAWGHRHHGWHHHHHGWHHHHHHHGWGWRPRVFVGGPAYFGGYGGCWVRRLVPTPWGPRFRLINRCF